MECLFFFISLHVNLNAINFELDFVSFLKAASSSLLRVLLKSIGGDLEYYI